MSFPLSHEQRHKVMDKDYYLVNLRTNERMIVHPPKQPGLNQNWENPMNDRGEYIRVFTIINHNGIKCLGRKRTVVLFHAPGEQPRMIDEKGIKWQVRDIKGITAPKKRLHTFTVGHGFGNTNVHSKHHSGETGIFTSV